MSFYPPSDPLDNRAEFITRHMGIEPQDERHMLQTIGAASLLDEAPAAAEAMALALRMTKKNSKIFCVAEDVLPQTLEVVRTRAKPLGITVVTGRAEDAGRAEAFAVLLQYPGVTGEVHDLKPLVDSAHRRETLVIV